MTTLQKGNAMKKQRIKLVLWVDLDPMPGTFHTPESAKESVEAILKDRIPHYNPMLAPLPKA